MKKFARHNDISFLHSQVTSHLELVFPFVYIAVLSHVTGPLPHHIEAIGSLSLTCDILVFVCLQKDAKQCCLIAVMPLAHEFHETCHSVTFIVLVNSHQR